MPNRLPLTYMMMPPPATEVPAVKATQEPEAATKMVSVTFNGSNGAGPCKVANVAEGDKVLGLFLLGDHAAKTVAGGFEETVSVAGEIQQTSTRDLSGNKYLAILQTPA